MIAPEEQRHLLHGPRRHEEPGGAGLIVLTVHCLADAIAVVDRCREVLSVVLAEAGAPWPSVAAWRTKLPVWFVDACAAAPSEKEAADLLVWWRTLSASAQARASRELRWTLEDWLFWLEPSERTWFWWDAAVEDSHTAKVRVEVPGWPAPVGALDWLMRAAGASLIDCEEPATV